MNAIKRHSLTMTILAILAVNAQANLLYNGGFEVGGGSLAGWTVFTTPTGTNGYSMPKVVRFDTCIEDCFSHAAKFNVGGTRCGTHGGGGISQVVGLATGTYQLKVCTAVLDNRGCSNIDGGLFELLFDDVVVDSYDYGHVKLGVTYRRLLAGDVTVYREGKHEVAIRITRTHSSSCLTPRQYLDRVELVPEPATIVLLGISGLSLLRKRKSA